MPIVHEVDRTTKDTPIIHEANLATKDTPIARDVNLETKETPIVHEATSATKETLSLVGFGLDIPLDLPHPPPKVNEKIQTPIKPRPKKKDKIFPPLIDISLVKTDKEVEFYNNNKSIT